MICGPIYLEKHFVHVIFYQNRTVWNFAAAIHFRLLKQWYGKLVKSFIELSYNRGFYYSCTLIFSRYWMSTRLIIYNLELIIEICTYPFCLSLKIIKECDNRSRNNFLSTVPLNHLSCNIRKEETGGLKLLLKLCMNRLCARQSRTWPIYFW